MKNRIIALMLFTMMNIAGIANAKSLSVPKVTQEGGNWCWLGSSKSILDYAGVVNPSTHQLYKQCELLEWVFLNDGSPDTDASATDVCLHPQNYYDVGEWPPGAPGIIGKLGWDVNHVINIEGSRTKPIYRALSFPEIKNEIDHYSPMLRKIQWADSNSTHLTVVKGYSESGSERRIIIMDPASGIIVTEYSSGVENKYGKWIQSLKTDMSKEEISNQEDTDQDGIGDLGDNCKNIYNPYQVDSDSDGIGDKCDLDLDNDGLGNADDNCKYIENEDQEDSDNDGVGDVCDNCKNTWNSEQQDSDCNGIGDVCTTVPSIFGCSGHQYLQYHNRLWEITHPLDPIQSGYLFKIKTISGSSPLGKSSL